MNTIYIYVCSVTWLKHSAEILDSELWLDKHSGSICYFVTTEGTGLYM